MIPITVVDLGLIVHVFPDIREQSRVVALSTGKEIVAWLTGFSFRHLRNKVWATCWFEEAATAARL